MNPNETEMRELDAWIAEHVFGWTVMSETLCDPKPEVRRGKQTGDVDINPVAVLPKYSTDPAAAFEVLKRCMEKVNHSSLHIYEREGIWIVHAGISSGGQSTLELAICRFAFQLYGGKTT